MIYSVDQLTAEFVEYVQVAAYYRSEKRRAANTPGDQDSDWFEGESEIVALEETPVAVITEDAAYREDGPKGPGVYAKVKAPAEDHDSMTVRLG
jgi:hypothetical protein